MGEIISKSLSIITHYWTLSEYLGPAKPAHDIHLTFNNELLIIYIDLEMISRARRGF